MKVKLYELLRMLREDELTNGERVVFDNCLYTVKFPLFGSKSLCYSEDGRTADDILFFSNLDKECELIDRKE